jgi:hypothetical protein
VNQNLRRKVALLLIISGLIITIGCGRSSTLSNQTTGTATAEPIVPTRTPALETTAVPTTSLPPATTIVSPSATVAASPFITLPVEQTQRGRFGITGDILDIPAALEAGLPFSHYLGWRVIADAPAEPFTTWQLIRVGEEGIKTSWSEIEQVLGTHPGSIWIIGNEPDVRWQDNVTAEQYAIIYHDAYHFIKAHDPTAQVAIAGVAQPTPLRLAYLDRILESYQAAYGQPLPVDLWNVHAYILREERDSWGVDIPPGMEVGTGQLYEIADHGDIMLFRQSILSFRAWMAERGYAERPLVVSEMGILLPPDYGFPPEFVADYMRQAFDFLLTAANESGYSADDGRLVQYWFWYSLYDPGAYSTGNLYDRQTYSLTPLGEAYKTYWGELFN